MIKKFISSEKSFNNQDKGIWTFSVKQDATKSAIQNAVEELFGVTVENVNVSYQRDKIRRLGGSKFSTRRHRLKIARVRLAKKSKKMDLTKLNK